MYDKKHLTSKSIDSKTKKGVVKMGNKKRSNKARKFKYKQRVELLRSLEKNKDNPKYQKEEQCQ